MKLVKWHNNILSVCRRVHAPGYTIHVADYEQGGTPPDGWQVMPDDVEEADFVIPWVQPLGAHDTYPAGFVVAHAGKVWRSLVDANVWEPGVSGWAEVTAGTPAWVQPLGAHDTYPAGFVVAHAGKVWRSLVDANVWEPGVANWRETALVPPGLSTGYPAWVQPTGAGDAYQIGERVSHNGKNWESTVSNNVWEPGVYGWIEV
jgi:hypothetical protein